MYVPAVVGRRALGGRQVELGRGQRIGHGGQAAVQRRQLGQGVGFMVVLSGQRLVLGTARREATAKLSAM